MMTQSPILPETIKAVAALISAIAWPGALIVGFFLFKPEMRKAISRIIALKAFGVEAKLASELAGAAENANKTGNPSESPTKDEIERSIKIEEITNQDDMGLIRREVEELAGKYELTRVSMPPGDERTRRLEVIVSQMRTIGRAAIRLRYELTSSSSPGKRLQAIASLQVAPDYDLVDWLAGRVSVERPFVAYHALVALKVAASDELARGNLEYLDHALEIVNKSTAAFKAGDRKDVAEDFRQIISRLHQRPLGAAVPPV